MKHEPDYCSFRCPTKQWGVCACANSKYQALFGGWGEMAIQVFLVTWYLREFRSQGTYLGIVGAFPPSCSHDIMVTSKCFWFSPPTRCLMNQHFLSGARRRCTSVTQMPRGPTSSQEATFPISHEAVKSTSCYRYHHPPP